MVACGPSILPAGRAGRCWSVPAGGTLAVAVSTVRRPVERPPARAARQSSARWRRLRPSALPGEFGETRVASQTGEAGLANVPTALTGVQNTQRSSTRLEVLADPARFAGQALRGVATANSLLVQAVAAPR